MTTKTDRARVPAMLACDKPDCPEEMMMRHHGEQYCFVHAVERGNVDRAKARLPPLVIDQEGDCHVLH